MTGNSADGVTISQAAAFAGVTVKTVRVYHRHGLVAEPRRDGSGYRRYGSAELLRLVQVRTLAASGVPLAEVGALLDSDADDFTAGVADVEAQLTAKIADLTARRNSLRQLADADRLLLPERARAILDRLAGLGFAPDYVAAQREVLILSRALAPEVYETFLTGLEHRLDDPEYVDLQKRGWEAESWPPDDPRLEDLAKALADNLLAHPELLALPADFQPSADASARYDMISSHREEELKNSARLTAMVEARLRAAGVAIPVR
ncbi:MerR family transcriptional regulator [Streptomyces sp. NPDC001941]|uniref:MerR family transcriptional regulator n=1 Tax=Streptomyces sp. NPDC001941 TaxID=3154659 RepID=UPI00333035EB